MTFMIATSAGPAQDRVQTTKLNIVVSVSVAYNMYNGTSTFFGEDMISYTRAD